VKKIPKNEWSFLTRSLYDSLYRSKSLRGYSEEVREQALVNVLDLVDGKIDEAIRADGLNITGSVLKDVARHQRNRRDKIEPQDGRWDEDLRKRWEKAESKRRTASTVSEVYDTADAFGLLTRDETVVYDVIAGLSKQYDDSRRLRNTKIAADVYRFGTRYLGVGSTIIDRIKRVKSKKPWEDNDKQDWLDIIHTSIRGADKGLEYIPFWTGALLYAVRIASREEAERLSYNES